MDVVRELVVIEAFRRLDRLRQHLAGGVGEGRKPIAQGIDAERRRLGLIFLQHRVGAGIKLSMMTKPFISGPSCTLIGVANIFVFKPISFAARTIPTVSGG